METLVLVGEAALTGLLAGWLILGVIENIRFPEINGWFVGEVMSMNRVRQNRDAWRLLGGNRVEDPRVHRALFRLIVAVEIVVALLLSAGAALLLAAALGAADPATARLWAVAGVIGWTGIWGAFLVGGQWFHYWIGCEGSQATHFFMTIWGVATFAALT